jgi:UDP-N-acetylmuramoyl-L-alanyl-D-glutamate--2,6-diaminopimelate ligase
MHELHSPQQAAHWLHQRVTGVLRTDSRQVRPGDGFIAWPGTVTDGRQYLGQALAQGAAACLMAAEGCEPWRDLQPADRLAALPQLKALTGLVADAYYEQPSHSLNVLAVTGTNGKTSTAWWLAQALGSPVLQRSCALVGTLGVGVLPQLESTGMTTPDPVLLQARFKAFADAGVDCCAIEASSIGLSERRLDGTRIRTAIFTNFTQDHLDYHGSMAAYWAAKRALFDWEGLQAAVINIDDPQGALLAQALEGSGLDVWTCSRRGPARLHARQRPGQDGLSFELTEGADSLQLETALIGDYNLDNLLGVIGALRSLGIPLAQAAQACQHLSAVPGRMERVTAPGALAAELPMALVDYAHTPDAVTQALQALQPLARQRGGQLWCVLGCGGDRDASKRPLMAAAAQAQADQLVLTSDNPRSESPEAILAQMVAGLVAPTRAQVVVDRAAAIALAVAQARPQDVLLVAGKGHEEHQEVLGVRHAFSDRQQLQQALQSRSAAGGLA